MGDLRMATHVLRRLLVALAAALVVAQLGCAKKDITPIEDVLREEEASAGEAPAYRLRPGDELRIEFASDRALTYDVPVTPSGTIVLPMAGEVAAVGLTTDELAEGIGDAMSAYLLDPRVSVLIKDVHRQPVYVIGEVRSPGRIEAVGGITITAALAEAGGIDPSGKPSSVMVVRTTGVEQPLVFKVDVTKILSARDMSQDVTLRENDVVYVPRSVIGRIDEFVDLFINKIAPAQLFYLRGYDMAHLKGAEWRW
jgi:protein involved in polysaccharide export with SLBB domain